MKEALQENILAFKEEHNVIALLAQNPGIMTLVFRQRDHLLLLL